MVAKRKFTFRFFKIKETGIFVAFILLFAAFSLASPYFFKVENLLNVVRQISLTGIMAVGMTLVIVSREIDLSVGGIYGLCAVSAGLLMTNGVPVWAAIIIALIVGIFIGFLNGILVTYVRIPALIVTLGMLNVTRGVYLLLSSGLSVYISSKTVTDPNLDKFIYLGQGKIFGIIPMMMIFLVIATISGYVLYDKSSYGFHLRAVGGNERAARASGINVFRVKILAFMITGFLCAIAGLLNLSFLSSVQGIIGSGLELEVIAATILGGTSLSGGEGTIIGTIIGALIMGILRNGLILIGVSPFWQTLMIGLIIIGAVTTDIWLKRKRV